MSSGPFEPEMDQANGLKLVDAPSESSTPGESDESPRDRTPWASRRLPAWLFVVALILFALLVGWQAQVASELKAEVALLDSQLERANALLDAHQTHLSEIRGGVHDLSESLLGLRALVDIDPSENVAPVPTDSVESTP